MIVFGVTTNRDGLEKGQKGEELPSGVRKSPMVNEAATIDVAGSN